MDFKSNCGKSQPAIFRELKYLKVNLVSVYRTITHYNDNCCIAKCYGSGHKKTATSYEMFRKIIKQIEGNPRQTSNQMWNELKIPDRSIRRILKVISYKISGCSCNRTSCRFINVKWTSTVSNTMFHTSLYHPNIYTSPGTLKKSLSQSMWKFP